MAPSFHVAGVAQSYIHLRFAWQAWHSWHSVARLGLVWARVTPRHFVWQVCTTLHPPSFHVAGVAQSYIHLRFAWQAWHSWHSVARLGLVWARVTPRHFARQAWHNLTSTFVSRGRRGTILHPPSFRVAGVALMALRGALGSGLGARDAAAFCVAGVAQPYIHLRFTWQAWHNLTSTFVCVAGVAGVALMALRGALGSALGAPWFHFRFMWQAWHTLTSTSVLRGRRGTISHRPSDMFPACLSSGMCFLSVSFGMFDVLAPACFSFTVPPACFGSRHVCCMFIIRHVLFCRFFPHFACLRFLHRHVVALRSLRHVLVSDQFAACLLSGMFFSVVSFRMFAVLAPACLLTIYIYIYIHTYIHT